MDTCRPSQSPKSLIQPHQPSHHRSRVSSKNLPVPVPMSRIRCGFWMGDWCSLRLSNINIISWCMSRLWIPPGSVFSSEKHQYVSAKAIPILLSLIRGQQVLVHSEVGVVFASVFDDILVDARSQTLCACIITTPISLSEGP